MNKNYTPVFFLLLFLFILKSEVKAQTFRWAKGAGSTDYDQGCNIKPDNLGNFYLTGYFADVMKFDSAGTTKSITSAGSRDIYLAKFNCSRNLVWVNRIGSTIDDRMPYGWNGVDLDSTGHIYVSGSFAGTATFGSQNGSSQTRTSAGGGDIFFCKYDTMGNLAFVVSSGSAYDDEGLFINVTRNGTVYVSGYFNDVATFNTTSGSSMSLTSSSAMDGFLAKYSSSGVLKWVKQCGGTGLDLIDRTSLDKNENIYATGNMTCCWGGTAYFGSHTLNNTGSWGAFIAKADSSGNWIWANGMGDAYGDAGTEPVVDDSGNVFFGGHFEISSTFTSSSPGSSISLTSNGGYDIVVAKLDSGGVLKWAKTFGGPYDDVCYGLKLNSNNNILVTGVYSGTASFGSTSITSAGQNDLYICEITKSGNVVYALSMGGTGSDYFSAVNPDQFGNIYVTGLYSGTASFGPFSLTSTGAEETFFAKIAPPTSFLIGAYPRTSLCNDSTFLFPQNFQNTVGYSFQWLRNNSPIAGATNDTLIVDTVGSYRLIITNKCNERDTSQAILITLYSGHVIISDTSKNICKGDSIQLVATGTNYYRWFPSSYLSDSTAANPYAKPIDTTTYIVKGITGSCVSYDTIVVKVNKNRVNAGSDKSICKGDSVQLTATNGSNYSWKPGVSLSDSSIANPYARPQDTTSYIVTALNGTCLTKDTVRVVVIPLPVTDAGPDSTICEHSTIQLHATASGTYRWSPTTGLSDSTSLSPSIHPSLSVKYYLLTDNGLCQSKDSVTITVIPALTINAGTDQQLCAGDSVQLNATGGSNYAWSPKTGMNDTTVANPKVSPATTTNYIVSSRTSGCAYYDTVQVTVNPKPTADAGTGSIICPNDSAQIHATASGIYHWNPTTGLSDSTSLNPYAHPNVSTKYYLLADNGLCQATDSVTISVILPLTMNAGSNQQVCAGDSVQLNATGGVNYAWSPKAGMNDTTIANPKVSPATTTNYIVQSGASGCTYYDTVLVTVNPRPLVDAGTGNTICQHDSAQIHATTSGTYHWNPTTGLSDSTSLNPYAHPNLSTTYYLVADNGLCQATDSVTITVILPLNINAGSNQQLCIGDSVQLNATGGSNYAWSPKTGMSDSTIANPNVSPVITTDYIVSSDNSGCKSYDTVTVTVNPKPIVDAGSDVEVCHSEPVQLLATSSGADSYSWSPATGLDNPGILQPTLFTSPGTTRYIITATNSGTGCFSKDSLDVFADSIYASFSANKNAEVAPMNVHFTNLSYNATQSLWFFDSAMSATSNETNPNYVFNTPGDYQVTLIVSSAHGCMDTAYSTIKVLYRNELFIPNVFTPNDDNINDYFIVGYDTSLFKKIEGSIWDRWGAKMYDFTMPGGAWWSGKVDSDFVPVGVYFYIITSEDVFGRKKAYRGTVSLLR